jgi:hypothetical protein
MSEPVAPAPAPQPQAATRTRGFTGRRFEQELAHFTAIGVVLRAPHFSSTRGGGAIATFSLKLRRDRELDLFMAARDIPELQYRLRDARPGTKVYVDGAILAPRVQHREPAQLYAEHCVAIAAARTSNRLQPTAAASTTDAA